MLSDIGATLDADFKSSPYGFSFSFSNDPVYSSRDFLPTIELPDFFKGDAYVSLLFSWSLNYD